jgi:hypothetical protein
LGSLGGKEWLIGVAPPGDLRDDARPRVEDIVAFRVPGDRLIKLHVTTWHAGPHFVHDERLFVNLENTSTLIVVIFTLCRLQSSAGTGSEPRDDNKAGSTLWQPLGTGRAAERLPARNGK